MGDIYDCKSFDPFTSIGALLARTRATLGAAADDALSGDDELARYEITSAQFVILSGLHSGHCECAFELCKRLGYDRGAMSRMLDRLESKGLIRRVRRPGERRAIALEITPQGEQLLPRVRATITRVLNRFLRGVSKSEVRQVESVLQRMLANG